MWNFLIKSPREWVEAIVMDKSERLLRETQTQVDSLKDLVNEIVPTLNTVRSQNEELSQRINEMANALDTLKAAVEAEKSVSAGIIALCDSIAQQLKDAIAGGDLNAIQSIADDLSGNTRAVQEAILRDTPAARVEPAPQPSGEAPAPDATTLPADASAAAPPAAPPADGVDQSVSADTTSSQ